MSPTSYGTQINETSRRWTQRTLLYIFLCPWTCKRSLLCNLAEFKSMHFSPSSLYHLMHLSVARSSIAAICGRMRLAQSHFLAPRPRLFLMKLEEYAGML
jgi:hypothetical protein